MEFAAYSDMKNAISKLDGTEINGRKIKLVEDKPKRSSRRRRYPHVLKEIISQTVALFKVKTCFIECAHIG